MDEVKHEISAALIWLKEGNVERAKLHLGFALDYLGDEAVEQTLAPDVCHSTADGRHLFQNDSTGRYCFACGIRR